MPLRSSGCFTCRKRKIRCDETRPACQRCETHGVSCSGYRTDQAGGIEFKDQTATTAQKAKEQYKAKAGVVVRKPSPAHSNVIVTSQSVAGLPWLAADWTMPNFPEHLLASDLMINTSSTPALVLRSFTPGAGISWIGDDLWHSSTPSRLPGNLHSPGVMREQLYSAFMDMYLPKNLTRMDHYSFIQRLASMPTNEPALLESLDALSLVTVGGLDKDRRLLNQSAKQYGKALQSLSRAISARNAAHSDELLAATVVLGMCALYDELGSQTGGWMQHVKGCQQLIAARGPESLQSEISMLLLSNNRHTALITALIERQAPLMARPEWRAVAFRSPIQDSSTTFYDLAIQVPGLLELHDKLTSEASATETDVERKLLKADELLLECQHIEEKLRDWYADWQLRALLDDDSATLSSPGLLFVDQSIDDFPTFTSVCHDRTIDTAFIFPNFAIAYLASLYWMCMYFIRTTIQSLHNLRHQLGEDWYPEQSKTVSDEERLEYAINLCKCIPFFISISSSTGHVGIFLPLRTAAIHFTTHGLWAYARWVGAVRTSVFTRGLSPPYARGPTDKVMKQERVGPKSAPDWRKAFHKISHLEKATANSSRAFDTIGQLQPSDCQSVCSVRNDNESPEII